MIHQDKSAAEIADIMVGMMPAKPNPRSNVHDKPDLIEQRNRIREKQYRLEDKQLEEGEIEIGEFDSNWSTGSRARKNSKEGRNY